MSPIQLLMDEHRLIEKVISALFAYADRTSGADTSAREDLAAFVAFIRGFADEHHHGKEEDLLFRAMTDQGMPTNMGPLAVMLREHDEGRKFTKALAEVADGQGRLEAEERSQLVWAAKSYGNLLRPHIQKEDQVLYPMADQMLPPQVWEALEKAFAEFETAPEKAARAAELRSSAEALIAKYAPAGD